MLFFDIKTESCILIFYSISYNIAFVYTRTNVFCKSITVKNISTHITFTNCIINVNLITTVVPNKIIKKFQYLINFTYNNKRLLT